MQKLLRYKIGITLLKGLGSKSIKKLVAYCGSVEAVFEETPAALKKINVPGLGKKLIDNIKSQEVLDRAEAEIEFIEKNNVTPLFYLDKEYPNRLKYCDDGPVMLYFKGKADFNQQKVISIVGTRNATHYGKKMVEELVKNLAPHQPIIVSGLAYGIDIHAHKLALKHNLSTIGVLAHGMDTLYPKEHAATARKMQENGGLLTEHIYGANFHPSNFPERNRIVAGMSDCTIVAESARKGGSLITAELANSYNRDVFAYPGKIGDKKSEGCNFLIKTNKAALIESAKDIEYIMGWEVSEKEKQPVQKQIFVELKQDEKELVDVLQNKGKLNIDNLCLEAKMPTSKVATILLNLEFSGVVRSLPGKMYELN